MNTINYGQGGANSYYQPKTKAVSTFSRPSGLNSWSIGLDHMWDLMDAMTRSHSGSAYPPYNLIKSGDDYSLEVAVAGFSREDLDITVQDNVLRIEGKKSGDETQYVHKGIAARNFKHEFLLGEYVEVTSAFLDNGILHVDLARELPEEKKPKTIKIK